MWNLLEKASDQVSLYATLSGQAWYLVVFLFRLIVVATIGSSVYSDEQSAFRCSTKVIGCDNVCYDKFAKISHIRFWSFQLLALSAPVVVFHFYTTHIKGRIEKLKVKEQQAAEQEEQYQTALRDESPEGASKWGVVRQRVDRNIQRRRSRIGKVKPKQVFAKTQLEEITLTRGIRVGYFISVLARFVMELIFLFLAYDLFRFAEYPYTPNDGRIVSDGRRVSSIFDLFWIRVPQLYRCGGDRIRWACGQHMLPGNDDAYIPCWVSRPWEKTIFLRYMNTLSVVCLLLALAEMIQLAVQACLSLLRRKKKTNSGYERSPSNATISNGYKRPSILKSGASREDVSTENETQVKSPTSNSSVLNNDTTYSIPKSSASRENVAAEKETHVKSPSPVVHINGTPTVNIDSSKPTPTTEQPQIPRKKPRTRNLPENRKDSEEQTKLLSVAEVTEALMKAQRRKSGQRQHPATKRISIPSSRKTHFIIPNGTQSLNRPKKMLKMPYRKLYQMGSISFSHSEEDVDEDESEAASEDRVSVSEHSDTEFV